MLIAHSVLLTYSSRAQKNANQKMGKWRKTKEKNWVWEEDPVEMEPQNYISYLKKLFLPNPKKTSARKSHLKFNKTFILKKADVSSGELVFFERSYRQFFSSEQIQYLEVPFPKYIPEICVDVKEFNQRIVEDAT